MFGGGCICAWAFAGDPGRMASSRPQELPIEGKTVRALTLLSVKRTLDMFAGSHGDGRVPLDEERCNEFDTWINWSGVLDVVGGGGGGRRVQGAARRVWSKCVCLWYW